MDLPLSAVMVEGDARYVWVVKGPDKVLERRDVKIEEGVGETVRVTDGLEAGDTLVASGGNYLQEGEKVRPWSD